MPKLILTLFLCFIPLGLWANTPEQSVAQLQVALDTKDLELFNQRINVNNVLEQFANTFVQAYQDPEISKLMPPFTGIIYSALAEPSMVFIKQLLMQEANNFVRDAVSSGVFTGQAEANTVKQSTILAPLLNNLSKERKEVVDIEKAVAINKEKTAYQVRFKIYDYENDKAFSILATLLPQAGDWRIEEISNLDEVLNEILASQN